MDAPTTTGVACVPFNAPRLSDWQEKFTYFIQDSQMAKDSLYLDWEHITCTSWVGQGIEAVTGENPYAPFDGLQRSVAQACRTIKQSGFTNLDNLLRAIFGHREIPIGFVTRADLVLVPVLNGWCNVSHQAGPIHDDTITEEQAVQVMPHGLALADPPFYWGLGPDGLGKGLLKSAATAFAIGREMPEALRAPNLEGLR